VAIHNQIVSVLGKSGSGKSFLVLMEMEKMLKEGKNLIIIDFKGEYKGLQSEHDITYLPIGRKMMARLNAKSWAGILSRYPCLIVHQLGLTFDELLKMIDDISAAVYVLGNRTLIIEEAHLLAPSHNIPQHLQVLITGGRTREVDLWFVCQRAALIDVTPISQSHLLYLFQLTEENDLKKIASVLSLNKETIIGLGRYKCLKIDMVEGTTEIISTEGLGGVEHYG